MIHRPDPRCPLVGDQFTYHGTNGSHPYTIVAVTDSTVTIRRDEGPAGTTWVWDRRTILPDIGKQVER